MDWQEKRIKNVSKELFWILKEDLLWQWTTITVTVEYHMGFGWRNWDKQLKPLGRNFKNLPNVSKRAKRSAATFSLVQINLAEELTDLFRERERERERERRKKSMILCNPKVHDLCHETQLWRRITQKRWRNWGRVRTGKSIFDVGFWKGPQLYLWKSKGYKARQVDA